MADAIVCSVCGESNPGDMEFCQNCQSRLVPLTGPLRGENAPLIPGQEPTKKVTSELEPILPQWLRDARKQARQSVNEEQTLPEEKKPARPAADVPDLLAGLASQKSDEEDDDETPDWVRGITGGPARKKKAEPESESSQVKWVELGHPEKTAKTTPPAASPAVQRQEPPAPERDELTEWFKQASGSAPAPDEKLEFIRTDIPAPDQPSSTKGTQPLPPVPAASDVFKDLDSHASNAFTENVEPAPDINTDAPDWIRKLDAQAPAAAPLNPPGAADAPAASMDIPDWLKNLGQEPAAAQPAPAAAGDALPGWLKTSAPSTQAPASGPVVPEPPGAVQPPPASAAGPESNELPDWITSLKSIATPAADGATPSASAFKTDEASAAEAAEPAAPASAFTESPDAGNDVDAIFASMKMPDWLSDVTLSKPAAEQEPPPAAQTTDESISPAELPSWVQAMRPVETAMSDASAPQDTRLEEQGILAGLHGVLPIIPGATAATSKPKSHSIKLDTTEQQRNHAALLEQILSAETKPLPMKAGFIPRSQRLLRWALGFLLIIVLGAAIYGKTQIFPLPGEAPNETNKAVQAVEAVPASGPVLVVFDYEPATVGEMEASGASLLDHLNLLRHPRFTLISTSPTGSALAERFMSIILTSPDHPEQKPVNGRDYIDLGYLPGGLAGVYTFAQNPAVTVPFSVDSSEAWSNPLLKGVTRLSDFAAVIVLTDTVESGRVWIEQTATARGNAPLIMVSSAQAGPMLLPYADSGQLNGLIAGLYGAAGAEQANGGHPGVTGAEPAPGAPATGFVRRYWDAYSIGLLLVAALITLGGLWNFWLGLQDRRINEAG